jgi:hypothetical protein
MELLKDPYKYRKTRYLIPPPQMMSDSFLISVKSKGGFITQKTNKNLPYWKLLIMHFFREGRIEKALELQLIRRATVIIK